MKIKALLSKNSFLTLIIVPYLLNGQLGINVDNSSPSSDAMLDIKSTNKGVLIPRLGTNVASPTEGLFYYNTVGHNFKYYDGTAWQQAFFGNQWNVNGSAISYSAGAVGIGIQTPALSAALEMASTSQGFLPPRMTKAQLMAISSPVMGLMIYCTNCGPGEIEVFSGVYWRNMAGGPVSQDLAIGDSFGGGKVAYILLPGDPGYIEGQVHGLIAPVSDQAIFVEWGCIGANMPGAEGTSLGTGNQNTIDIVTGCATAGIAARLCRDLVTGGYSDWYLPSEDELNKLYLNRVAIGGFASIAGANYWSSSESTNNEAWRLNFCCGNQGTGFKNVQSFVRAVRAF